MSNLGITPDGGPARPAPHRKDHLEDVSRAGYWVLIAVPGTRSAIPAPEYIDKLPLVELDNAVRPATNLTLI